MKVTAPHNTSDSFQIYDIYESKKFPPVNSKLGRLQAYTNPKPFQGKKRVLKWYFLFLNLVQSLKCRFCHEISQSHPCRRGELYLYSSSLNQIKTILVSFFSFKPQLNCSFLLLAVRLFLLYFLTVLNIFIRKK